MSLKLKPVVTFDNLRRRVERLFTSPKRRAHTSAQLRLELQDNVSVPKKRIRTRREIAVFINSISDTLKFGDVYLFGGVLRDLALAGRSGFNSDIDLVVDGDWESCENLLLSLNSYKNKFGGYRLEVNGWPIDIWRAENTWAITEGLVNYENIASLTKTTVLNWDAILMNWRTHEFICQKNYLKDLKERAMDIVLEANPNPLGMAVRVFRHLCAKDAKSITPSVAEYLANCTLTYSLPTIKNSEFLSYGNSLIEPTIYKLFEKLKHYEHLDIHTRFKTASENLKKQGASLTFQQLELELI